MLSQHKEETSPQPLVAIYNRTRQQQLGERAGNYGNDAAEIGQLVAGLLTHVEIQIIEDKLNNIPRKR